MLYIRNLSRLIIALTLLFPCYTQGIENAHRVSKLEDFRGLEQDIKQVLIKHDLVGFQLSINGAEEMLWNMNYGLASISANTSITDESLFRFGSVSKTITAVAIMQLVDKGYLSLEQKLQSLVPEIMIENRWQDETPITVLHLLEHTAGFDDNHFKEYVVDGSAMTTKQALDYHPHTRVSRYEPGLFMSYANVDPTLLAYIVEKLTGLSFEEYVKQNIFTPLEMAHTDYFFTDYVQKNLATGYIKTNNGLMPADYEFLKDRASGAINSSTTGMSNFQRMLINLGRYQDRRILTKSAIERMAITESTLAAKAGFHEGYGKFLITQRSQGGDWQGHNGEMNGFLSAMWHNPERQVGYLFVGNTSGSNAYQADTEINQLLRQFLAKKFPKTIIKKARNEPQDNNEFTGYDSQILGQYRRFTSRLALFGFIEGLESFSSVYVEDDVVKMTTSHTTYTLKPVAHNAFTTRLTNGDEITVIFIEHSGQWYYQVPHIYINAIQTSQLSKVASLGLLICFVVMALIVFSILLIRFSLRFLGKGLFDIKGLGYLSIANAGLFSCFILLVSAGSTGKPFNILGQPSVQSVGLFISLLVFLIFTLCSIVKFWKFRHDYWGDWKARLLGYFTASAIFTNLIMLATLQYFNFLFVMLWLY